MTCRMTCNAAGHAMSQMANKFGPKFHGTFFKCEPEQLKMFLFWNE